MKNPWVLFGEVQAFRQDALSFFGRNDLYGAPVTSIDLGIRDVKVITRAEVAEQALTLPSFIRGKESYGPLGTFAGQGSLRALIGPTLPMLDGEDGLDRRKIMRPVYTEAARKLASKGMNTDEIDWSDIEPGECDLYRLVSAEVFARFCQIFIGQTYPSDASRITEAIHRATDLLDMLSKSFRPYACARGPAARSLRTYKEDIVEFSRMLLRELRDAPDAPMARLLDGALSEEEQLEEMAATLIASLETTTLTSCWSIVQLLRHPEYLDRIRHSSPDVARHWVKLCVKETLRQYPAFWTLIRVVTERTVTPEHTFEEGDIVFISPLLIHHNPAHWERPDSYEPERHDSKERRARGAYIPFGHGARACIGAHIATQIIQEIVYGVRSFRSIRFTDKEPERDPKIILLKSHTGFRVVVNERPATDAVR